MELGVDLEYILQDVNSRIAQEGFIFIKRNNKTDKFCKKTYISISEYELRSRLFGKSFDFLKEASWRVTFTSVFPKRERSYITKIVGTINGNFFILRLMCLRTT